METKSNLPKNIDEYISRYSLDIQEILNKIRSTIQQAVPGAQEVISYQMPAFRYAGYMLIFFAAHEKHIGLYPVPMDNPAFQPEISQYASGKATLQFSYDQPIPYDLITKIVLFKAKENEARAALKKSR